MKTVTRYQARDGSVWDAPADAKKRDALYDQCLEVGALLPEVKDPGHGKFVQLDREAVNLFHDQVIELARQHTAWWDGWAKVTNNRDVHPGSIVGRIVDDSNLGPLNKLFWRLHCIDRQGRQWDQPYFANKANEEVPR